MASSYQELNCIGRGTQGSVYTVRHLEESVTYVLKRMHIAESEQRRAALLEAETLQRLQHPGVVGYRDTFVDGEYLSLVMEYCEGGDLASRIAANRDRPFAEEQILQWVAQLALALHHVHERGVLHRDLKTQNVFLTAAGQIKLGDFGIAKQIAPQSAPTLSGALTATCVGTPYYMSPELFRGEAYGGKSDAWALGCVLFELVARRRAFQSPNLNSLSVKVMRGEHGPLPPCYSSSLHDLVRSLLAVQPSNRPSISSLLSHPMLRRHVVAFGDATLGPHGEAAQLAHAALAALRSQLLALGLYVGTSGSSTSRSSIAAAAAEEVRIEEAMWKLDEERRWRQRERRACRALGPSSSQAQYAVSEGGGAAGVSVHSKPMLSPKPSKPSPSLLSPPPPLPYESNADAALDWVGGDSTFREQFSLSRKMHAGVSGSAAAGAMPSIPEQPTQYGRRAGEPRSARAPSFERVSSFEVSREGGIRDELEAASLRLRDGLTAGRFDFPTEPFPTTGRFDFPRLEEGLTAARFEWPMVEDEAAVERAAHAASEYGPIYASPVLLPPAFSAFGVLQPPELTLSALDALDLPASAYDSAFAMVDRLQAESAADAAPTAIHDAPPPPPPPPPPLSLASPMGMGASPMPINSSPMPLSADNNYYNQSAKDRVLARRESRKLAEAAAREDELLHARQRYFQERVLADYAQRTQYQGHLGPSLVLPDRPLPILPPRSPMLRA
jgi:serine/threonine protein kinase